MLFLGKRKKQKQKNVVSDRGTAHEAGAVGHVGGIPGAVAHHIHQSNSQEVMGVYNPALLGDNNPRMRRARSQAAAWVGKDQEGIEEELR